MEDFKTLKKRSIHRKPCQHTTPGLQVSLSLQHHVSPDYMAWPCQPLYQLTQIWLVILGSLCLQKCMVKSAKVGSFTELFLTAFKLQESPNAQLRPKLNKIKIFLIHYEKVNLQNRKLETWIRKIIFDIHFIMMTFTDLNLMKLLHGCFSLTKYKIKVYLIIVITQY